MKTTNLLFLFAIILNPQLHASESLASSIATKKTIDKEHILNGVVEAIKQSTVSAQVSGRVTHVNFDVDDMVKKGDVILRIRNTEYKARLKNAQASLKEAQANLKESQLELQRITGLYADKMVSESIFDKTKAQVKSNEARVAASEAKITEAKEQLNNTKIKAPYSGIVVKRHIEVGETTNVGQAVMTGFDMRKLRVAVDVPQSIIHAIREHKTATLMPLNIRHNKISSNDLTIFPFANPESHAFHVRVNFKQELTDFYPGMLVKVAFKVDNTERLLIPSSSVVHRSEVVAVYVIDENQKIKLRQIRTGHKYDDSIEVLAGLMPGEKVAKNPIKAGVKLKQVSGLK